MQVVNGVAWHAKACNKNTSATFHYCTNSFFNLVGKRGEEVDTKWFLRCASSEFHFFNELGSFHGGGAKCANASGF